MAAMTAARRPLLADALRLAIEAWTADLRWARGCAPATVVEREQRIAEARAWLGELAWEKTCSCGRRYTREEWDALPLLGRQAGEPDLELRNCGGCGSTLAVEAD